MSKKSALKACVKRLKTIGLTGKARDDAAAHFLAGAAAADPDNFSPPADGIRYVDVLEQLSDLEDDEDGDAKAPAADPATAED